MNPKSMSSTVRLLAACLFPLLLAACSHSPDKYGVTEMFHGRPKPIRKVPRTFLGNSPAGLFDSHTPHSILVMDSGADYHGETGLTYLSTLAERYKTSKGMGDVPVHYFIDKEGIVFSGRDISTPAEIHEGDAFTLRPSDTTPQEAARARLSRLGGKKLNLNGYVVIMVLGDYDQEIVNEKQEKGFFQLVSNLVYDQNISRDNIFGFRERFPESKNPGFYLNNYLQASVLEKNVPEPPGQHRYLIPPDTGVK